MPSRKKSKPISHRKIGANLRAAGLLPKGYKLNALTSNQKDRIRKLYNKYPGASKHPKDFVSRTISKATARTLRAAGYPVKFSKTRGGKPVASFATHGALSVDYRAGTVRRNYGTYRSITPISTHGKTLHERAQEFFKNRKPGQYLFLAHGPDARFGTRIGSMEAFEKYLPYMQRHFHGTPEEFAQFKENLYIIESDQDLGKAA